MLGVKNFREILDSLKLKKDKKYIKIIFMRKKFKLYRLNKTKKRGDKIDEKYQRVVLERIKIIRFFEKYGEEATMKGFGIARSTVFLWKKKLMEMRYHPNALIPGSRASIRRRQKEWHPLIVEYIIKRRWENPRLGHEPLKKELDEFCRESPAT